MTTWPEVPLRRIFRIVNGGTPTGDATNWEGEVPWATPVDLGRADGGVLRSTDRTLTEAGLLSGSRLVPVGALVVSTRAPIGYVAEAGVDLAFNQGCRGLVPVTSIDSRYFRYQLSTMTSQLESRGQGSTFSELSTDGLAASRVVWPPVNEQRAIANFLDTQTARIDALIAKKRRMAELLETRYQVWLRSRIRQLPVADLPLKRGWRVIDCRHRTPTYVSDGGYPVVSPGDIEPGRLELTRAHRFVDDVDYLDLTGGGRRPKRGDIIYSRNASIGIAAYVDTDRPFCMGQDVCLITSDDQDQLYLSYVLNSLGVDQLQIEKVGTTFSRINVAQILELRVPAPAPNEQRELSAAFDRERQRVDHLVAKLTCQVDLLTERRQALITAAVTGELDVAESIAGEAS